MKYWMLFAVGFAASLAWLAYDHTDQPPVAKNNTTQTVRHTPETAQPNALPPAALPIQPPVVATSNPAVAAQSAPTEPQQAPVQAMPPPAENQTVATFRADTPYLPPEQRTPGNLGGPPSREMMLTSPHEAY